MIDYQPANLPSRVNWPKVIVIGAIILVVLIIAGLIITLVNKSGSGTAVPAATSVVPISSPVPDCDPSKPVIMGGCPIGGTGGTGGYQAPPTPKPVTIGIPEGLIPDLGTGTIPTSGSGGSGGWKTVINWIVFIVVMLGLLWLQLRTPFKPFTLLFKGIGLLFRAFFPVPGGSKKTHKKKDEGEE